MPIYANRKVLAVIFRDIPLYVECIEKRIETGSVDSTFGVLFLHLFLMKKEKKDYENSKRYIC